MKLLSAISLLVLTGQLSRADFTFSGAGDIPQMNPVGLVSVGTVSGISGRVTGMSLDLTVLGGFNGDLYAYLVAPNQTTAATLLGTPGGNFDQAGSGYQITLTGTGAGINGVAQDWGTPVTGIYQPVVDLLGTFGSYLTANGANGDWRLFLANQSNGGQSTLGTWNLTFITTAAVPEPEQVAAISLLGLIGLMVGSYRRWGQALGFKKL